MAASPSRRRSTYVNHRPLRKLPTFWPPAEYINCTVGTSQWRFPPRPLASPLPPPPASSPRFPPVPVAPLASRLLPSPPSLPEGTTTADPHHDPRWANMPTVPPSLPVSYEAIPTRLKPLNPARSHPPPAPSSVASRFPASFASPRSLRLSPLPSPLPAPFASPCLPRLGSALLTPPRLRSTLLASPCFTCPPPPVHLALPPSCPPPSCPPPSRTSPLSHRPPLDCHSPTPRQHPAHPIGRLDAPSAQGASSTYSTDDE